MRIMCRLTCFGIATVFVALAAPQAGAQQGQADALAPQSDRIDCTALANAGGGAPQKEFWMATAVQVGGQLAAHFGKRMMDRMFDYAVDSLLAQDEEPTEPRAAIPEPDPCPAEQSKYYRIRGLPVGIAYRVYKVDESGAQIPSDPGTRFRNGEIIIVKYFTNVPGILTVENHDVEGQVQSLGQWPIPQGVVASLGPFRFYGKAGVDSLRISQRPCRLGPRELSELTALGVPAVGEFAVRQDALAQLPTCAATANSQGPSIPRESLVQVDGYTGFAVGNIRTSGTQPKADEAIVTVIHLEHY